MPIAAMASRIAANSASVSEVKWLTATTTGRPNFCRFSTWRCRLAMPRFTASTFSGPSALRATPPCIFSARTVATTTAQDGFSPADRHLMSRNFSPPRSAPKPASVTTTSDSFRPSRVAMTELQPWAMLANGPPCTSAGEPSSVCTRLGATRVLQQHRHRAVGLQVGGGDVLAVARLRHDHLAEPGLQFRQVAGQAEHRHHFGGDGDVEPVLPREAVGDAAQAADDAAQRAVVHVQAAAPGDPARVDAQRIAPVDGVVDHRGEQVVGRGDGVEIAGEMQVDLVHRHDLRVAAARRAALHAEAGAQAGLAQADRGALADAVQRVAETDRRGGLALAGRGRVDAGDQHQRAVGARFQAVDEIQADLRLVAAIGLHRVVRDAELGGDLLDGAELGGAGDFEIWIHVWTGLSVFYADFAQRVAHGVEPHPPYRRV